LFEQTSEKGTVESYARIINANSFEDFNEIPLSMIESNYLLFMIYQ
jgi:hypothetical protein